MRTIKEFFLRHYYSLWLSPSLSPPSHMNSNDVENHRNSDVATKQRKINKEEGRGESSSIFSFVCEICIDTKTEAENFSITGCSHSYCTDCVVKYVGSKLDDNVINIRCPVPRCGGFLELDGCREVLPKMVFDRWVKLLCEAAVVENESERFMYFPFKDCSTLISSTMIHRRNQNALVIIGRYASRARQFDIMGSHARNLGGQIINIE
ncbi:hypothetical protein HN51_061424 [Arachis hypogaea]|uniref:RING-type domain-containing protein n=1 Tax=Arachis hypogaea TaxID=3818 RepID=A0A445AN68_ARAHY|nr:C6HC-type zinc finger RING/U-box protein [Arachis hypogaea]RYR27878.1 hypothetical protein Ahy_B01g051946 [Arachis hypogaea]